jgi:hypothetical protein
MSERKRNRLGEFLWSKELEAQALRWLMRSLKIREALAFNGYFAATGFVELRA